MIPDAVWPGSVLMLGSRLIGLSPRWWVVIRIARVSSPGEPYWSLIGERNGGVVRGYDSYEFATMAAGAAATVPTVVAVAIVACDRPLPPVPSGEESTACDAVVVWVGDGRGNDLAPQDARRVGKGQLVSLFTDLYAPAQAGAGKGGSDGQ